MKFNSKQSQNNNSITRMMGIKNASELRNLALVYLLIFVSGTHLFIQSSSKQSSLLLAFLLSVTAWYIWSDRKINIQFIFYLITLSTFLLILYFYTGGSLTLPSVMSTGMKLVIPYLILKAVNNEFLTTYIKLMVFIASISLIGYTTDRLGLLNGIMQYLHYIENIGYEGFFYVFKFYLHIDRNNSIFYEPGAYQIFINVALYILFFFKTNFTWKQRNIFIVIFIITLITTFSTTGYIIFALMMVLVIFKSRVIPHAKKLKLLLVLFVASIGLAGTFNQVLVGKIERYLETQHLTDSQERRSFDMRVDLEIFKRNMLGIGHKQYSEKFSSLGYVKEGTSSSNGITYALAVYGLPFVLFYFGSYFVFFMKLFTDNIVRIGSFAMLLIFIFSESNYLFSPILFSLIAAMFVVDWNKYADSLTASKEI